MRHKDGKKINLSKKEHNKDKSKAKHEEEGMERTGSGRSLLIKERFTALTVTSLGTMLMNVGQEREKRVNNEEETNVAHETSSSNFEPLINGHGDNNS